MSAARPSAGAMESKFTHAYERFGVKGLFMGAAIVASVYAGVAMGVEALGALLYWDLSASEFLTVLGVGFGLCALAGGLALLTLRREIKRLFQWERDGKPESESREMWEFASRAPLRFVTRIALVAAVLLLAVMAPFLAQFLDRPLLGLLAVSGVLLVACGCGWVFGLFTLELVARPILKELYAEMPSHQVEAYGWRLRTRALVAIPLVTLTSAAATGPFVAAFNDPEAQLAISLVSGLVVAALFAVGLRFVVTEAFLSPVGDLTAGVERVTRGDLSQPVPVTTADELSDLAQAFNSMQAGLRERESLRSEKDELLEEVLASRARIVAASDAERRRVERNLHDGAQQRLVAVALQLQLLADQVSGDPKSREMTEQVSAELKGALGDLRELARGLHPQVLTEGGLVPAIEQLAARAPVPVTVGVPSERFPEDVESTAYFVVSEALANVAKYSQAQSAEVSAERRNGSLVLAISDDGVGDADPNGGSGLKGLADRVAALDGRLHVKSPAGAGTTVTMELPLASNGGPDDQG